MQRRRQLEYLLDLRWHLALAAAAHVAHNLPDGLDLQSQQYAVEDAIRVGWPDVYEERWPSWVEHDAGMLHASDVLIAECTICVALARHARINLKPPYAA
jgi:hypothetical protein